MTKRGCLVLSAESLIEKLNLPDDINISKIVIDVNFYTVSIYGFSEIFEDTSEKHFILKTAL